MTYCTYNGIAIGGEDKHNVEGRILIDVVGYNKYERTRGKREGDDPETRKNRATKKHDGSVDEVDGTAGAEIDGASHKHLDEKRQLQNREEMLARQDNLIYMSPVVEGYALKNKLWCKAIQ